MSAEQNHGGKREGAGRPKGSLGKRSVEAIEAVAERWPNWSPLMHFAEVANDDGLDPEIRLDAAKAAAPYVHPRPKVIEIDPDALVDLEGRVAAARAAATIRQVDEHFGLSDRLERARRRIEAEPVERPRAPASPIPVPEAAPSKPAAPTAPASLAEPGPAPSPPKPPAPEYKPIPPLPAASPEQEWPRQSEAVEVDYDPMGGSYKF